MSRTFVFRVIRGLVHLASWLVNLLLYRRQPPAAADVKHILLFKLDNLGDFVLALPALLAIRRRWPDARWTAVASGHSTGIAALFGAEVVRYDSPFLYPFPGRSSDALAPVGELADMPVDLIVDFRSDPMTLLVALRSRARWRVEIGKQRVVPTLRKLLARRGSPVVTRHESDVYLRAVEPLGIHWAPDDAREGVLDAARAREILERVAGGRLAWADAYVVIHIGASVAHKRWPVVRFVELAASLHRNLGLVAVLIGSPGERRLLEGCGPLPDGVVDLVGATSLGELFAVIRGADLVVANDSAIGHIAAFEIRPLLTLYGGPSSEEAFAPRGGGAARVLRHPCVCTSVEQDECAAGPRWCLAAITVSNVEEEVRRLLRHGPEAACV